MENTKTINCDNIVEQNSNEDILVEAECGNVVNQAELVIEKETPLDLAKKILPLADKGLSTTRKDNNLFILFVNIYAFTRYKLIPEVEKINNFEIETEELKNARYALAKIIDYSDKGFDLTDLSEEEECLGKDFSEVHRLFGQILMIADDELRGYIPTPIE